MDFTRKLSLLVFLLCVLISLKKQRVDEHDRKAENQRKGKVDFSDLPLLPGNPLNQGKLQVSDTHEKAIHEWLRYDYYNESCPLAEQIIRSTLRELFELRSDVAPALIRLAFHDCFVQGCDASVLLDSGDEIKSEKEARPNESLKGFDLVDIIKTEVEEACPGVVSCADIVVLAARESVLLTGGPFYPLYTGRMDSKTAFLQNASNELPSPHDDLPTAINSFASKGFDERETVSLLGAHSTGTIHCEFFMNRLYNFRGRNEPDPSIDTEFLKILRSKCNSNHPSSAPSASASLSASPSLSPSQSLSPSPSLSSSPSSTENSLSSPSSEGPGMKMDYEGPGIGFGTIYYRSLLRSKGLLFVDQQLTSGEETQTWVRAYASDFSLFHRDFGLSMIKLSNLKVLTAPNGEVRLNCRKPN